MTYGLKTYACRHMLFSFDEGAANKVCAYCCHHPDGFDPDPLLPINREKQEPEIAPDWHLDMGLDYE